MMSDRLKNSRILISATGSNKGKTMISSAVLYLLKESGEDIHAFKCGPDYIDPQYHSQILGIPSKNLDPFFCNEELLRSSFIDGSGELNLLEGAMGLFDGMGTSSEYGTYDVAEKLSCPILLIIDCGGMGASILAEIAGFLSMDSKKLIKGVFLNRISEAFYEKIKIEIEKNFDLQVLGYLPKLSGIQLESRHLGLKNPEEYNAIEAIETVAEILKDTLDMENLIKLAENAKPMPASKPLLEYIESDLSGITIGVGKDEAFSFYYEDNLKALKLAGARLVDISPIHDKTIEPEIDALYLGGGYPEIYSRQLAKNHSFIASIRDFIMQGKPVLAECGAFLYMQEELEGCQMTGIFKGQAYNAGKLVRFGYIEAEYKDYHLKGHEFHYYDVTDPGQVFSIKKASTGGRYTAVCKEKRCIAGFPHFYFLSDSRFLEEFRP